MQRKVLHKFSKLFKHSKSKSFTYRAGKILSILIFQKSLNIKIKKKEFFLNKLYFFANKYIILVELNFKFSHKNFFGYAKIFADKLI